ncbi:hypothetical protein MHUMG1_04089 [Metarhizium humberi]|uniref:AB hydrolase-1 domain-containing protein n=2 Tax=Metarhizium TaxID=5529 RepID=A0A0D9P8N2_METAN|nr:hypothetical protein MHUMG1_04089 [Metarhizium humberi]KJK82607.1 hypothetical protein H634G_01744 [Metarhizium anisopliae BRIP 53293]KJK93350.1 hypothetical protein H633G_02728 [Metarhizium anisopliae BRIP 53284]
MDHWDPALINPLAGRRPVVLIDNAGVGRSQGQVGRTFADWARNYVDVMRAIGIRRADVMGFSMGGCVAQMVALDAPSLVRSLILCGTAPSTGDGVVKAPLGPFNQLKAAVTVEEHRRAFLDGFFHTSERSQAAGMAAWDRIAKARSDRSDYVDAENAHRQAVSFVKFMDPKQAAGASYDRFHELQLPVLIANGCNDLLLPTENSILMWKKLSHANAQLHLYPDSGHGFLFQHATVFSGLINEFLDDAAEQTSRL